MKNILVLASTYPRRENDTEPAFVEFLCRELVRENSVHVLAPHCEGAAVQALQNGINVHRFRYFFPSLENLAYQGGMLANLKRNRLNYLLIPFFMVSQIISIWRLHRRYGFNVVHAHWLVPQGLAAVIAKYISGRKFSLLITSHGGDLYALNGKLMTKLKTWIAGKADHMTVVSEAMKQYCASTGIRNAGISVCSMGVDLQKTFVKKIPFSGRAGLVFVGRLVEKKGVQYLIEAIDIVRKEFPSVRLIIVGDGPERVFLEKLVLEKGLDKNISFTGAVTNREVPDYLNRAKIAVMPSVVSRDGDQEGLGLVAVEAMGCGCAVIASDLPAVRDVVIDGSTGIMAAPASATSIADAILRLLNDEILAETIAGQGHASVISKYDWKIIGNRYHEIIAGL